MKLKKLMLFIAMSTVVFMLVACGINKNPDNTENLQGTEQTEETEPKIEIIDAAEILTKVWDEYAVEERFEVMGGHFETAVIGGPAKYDLTQSVDLVQMYCMPEILLTRIDDAATMTDFYNVGRFTVGAYHVSEFVPESESEVGTEAETESEIETEVKSIQSIQDMIEEMHTQIIQNEWHGEIPEKVLIMEIDEEYIVAVWGRESLVTAFKQKLEAVYPKMVNTMVQEKFPE